jgi:hypothetical protein
MPSTTYAEFGHDTEALEVAKVFADGIRGKTIIVTGVSSGGIGYTTLQAFVRLQSSLAYYLARRGLTNHTGVSIPSASYPC